MRSRARLSVFTAFILTALLLLPASTSAQTTTSFGVQGGLNVANVDFTPAGPDEFNADFKSRNRGVFGGFVAWDFKPSVGLQIDVLYSQKGAKASGVVVDDEGTTADLQVSVDYLEFPVLLRGNMRASDTVTFRLFGGPSFGFKVSDEIKFTAGGEEFIDDETDISSSDVGFVLGGAVQFGKFFVDLRYNWGMMNVLKDDEDGEEIKTRTFGFMVGFAF